MAACLHLHIAAGSIAGSGKGGRQLESAAFSREGLLWALLNRNAAALPFDAAHFQVRWLAGTAARCFGVCRITYLPCCGIASMPAPC